MTLLENPTKLPDPANISRIEEPYVKARIMAPTEYIGGIMKAGAGTAGGVPWHEIPRHQPGGVRF